MTESESGVAARASAYPVKPIVVAFLLDAVAVVVFSAIGRASHGAHAVVGLWDTAWTFLLALVIAWSVSLAWRAPLASVRTGLPVWALTVAGGMLLRGVSGQGVQVAFVIVAAIALLVMLVGWRLIAALLVRRRR